MHKRVRAGLMLIFAGALSYASPGRADLAAGLDALRQGDYATAAKALRPLADQGNAEAQYRLGLMLEFGKGFAVDKTQALAWLRKAAAQGHVAAELELGVIYASGDGVAQNDAEAVGWFRKAAEQGNATAQYNLGLMIAKGQGTARDDAQAIAWFRKAAEQGLALAQYKLGVAHEYGEGVAKDEVVAYADYAIATRADARYAANRDAVGKRLAPSQLREAQALAADWETGKPMPARTAAATDRPAAKSGVAPAPDRCSATGAMEGEKFVAKNCAVSLYGDAHSVAIWFNEDAISPEEAASFQVSSYADGSKGGKQRTMATIMFCPGGGSATANAAAVKSIDLNTNHAKSPLAGVQWVVEAPKDFKVEKMSGDVKPGGALSGRIVGGRGKTTWTFEFDVTLPVKDAAAGMSCKG